MREKASLVLLNAVYPEPTIIILGTNKYLQNVGTSRG